MRYRLTALTPLLVGDGNRYAPIDYMVWKDQVNVLDQQRIFRLLSRGPRLEGYLTQLRRAEKLDFASWGGFAQNYAARRIPFEHPSSSPVWQQTPAEFLFIPTFCSGTRGPYLPGSALKGALRTAVAATRVSSGVVAQLASRIEGGRGPRRPGEAAEGMTLGPPQNSPLRGIAPGDSDPVDRNLFRVYPVRVATAAKRGDRLELAWKQSPRGYASTPSGGTPVFAEMAPPRTAFTGAWKSGARHEKLFQAANEHAAKLLGIHRDYADRLGLTRVQANLEQLISLLGEIKGRRDACLLDVGWAGGFLSKAAFLDTGDENYRKLLSLNPAYDRALRTGLPFPKTRRVVFEKGEPGSLPGWAMLEVG